MRMAGAPSTDPEERTARLRIRIPAIRSFKRQEAAKAELLEAIAAEMLKTLSLSRPLLQPKKETRSQQAQRDDRI